MENFNKDEPFIVTPEEEKSLDVGFFMNSKEIEAKFNEAETSLKNLEAMVGADNADIARLKETIQWLMEMFVQVKEREMKAGLN